MTGPEEPGRAVRALYEEIILDHYPRPRNHGELDGEHRTVEKRNPACGDEITLQPVGRYFHARALPAV